MDLRRLPKAGAPAVSPSLSVLEVAADPYRWQQLVVDGELTHDGGTPLARHVANAILREDSRGARLSKETKDSPRRIDQGSLGRGTDGVWVRPSRGCWQATNGHHPRLPPTLSPPIRRRTSVPSRFLSPVVANSCEWT